MSRDDREDDYRQHRPENHRLGPATPRPSRLARIRSHRMFVTILVASIIVAVGVLGTVVYFVTESYWDRQAMLADLHDPDPQKRSTAALNIEHLARNASAGTRPRIVNQLANLLGDPDPGVRHSALNGLSQFRKDSLPVWEQCVPLI